MNKKSLSQTLYRCSQINNPFPVTRPGEKCQLMPLFWMDCLVLGFSMCFLTHGLIYLSVLGSRRQDFYEAIITLRTETINWREQERRVMKQHSEFTRCQAVCAKKCFEINYVTFQNNKKTNYLPMKQARKRTLNLKHRRLEIADCPGSLSHLPLRILG